MQTLIRQMDANCKAVQAILDKCTAEKRTRNEAEEAEYNALIKERQYIQMRMAAYNMTPADNGEAPTLTKQVRSMLQSGHNVKMEYAYKRAEGGNAATLTYTGVADVQAGGAEPVKIEDVVKPLYEGLILNTVGIDLRTGLSGEYVWPVVEAATVKVAGEAVKIGAQKINMSKVKARPERVSATLSLTRQSVIQSDGLVEALATQLLPEALAAGINQIMFSTDKELDTTDNLVGPFVALKSKATAIASPTYKAFCKMKAQVLKSGIPGSKLCWVMTKSTAAELEGTPRDAGSGIMLIEDGKLCGLPVFTTEAIGDGYVGLGDWAYQVLGLFGDIAFTVDPYTGGDSDIINFYLNAYYGTATLRPEAFALAKVTMA